MTVVCITGMHRIGTSLLTRVVNLLGVSLGPERHLIPATDDNPAGYWEDNRIVQLDDQLLGFLGGWWHQPPSFEEHWEYEWRLEPFRVWAAQLVADRTNDAGPVGFKDPRLSLLLPFWRTVVPIDRSVIGVRHPGEVARSLSTRDDFASAQSAYLWLRYTASAIVNDPTAVAVRYDDWFTDATSAVSLLCDHLGIDQPSPGRRAAIEAACDPSLRRSHTDPVTAGEVRLERATAFYERLHTGVVAGLVEAAREELAALTAPSPA